MHCLKWKVIGRLKIKVNQMSDSNFCVHDFFSQTMAKHIRFIFNVVWVSNVNFDFNFRVCKWVAIIKKIRKDDVSTLCIENWSLSIGYGNIMLAQLNHQIFNFVRFYRRNETLIIQSAIYIYSHVTVWI